MMLSRIYVWSKGLQLAHSPGTMIEMMEDPKTNSEWGSRSIVPMGAHALALFLLGKKQPSETRYPPGPTTQSSIGVEECRSTKKPPSQFSSFCPRSLGSWALPNDDAVSSNFTRHSGS